MLWPFDSSLSPSPGCWCCTLSPGLKAVYMLFPLPAVSAGLAPSPPSSHRMSPSQKVSCDHSISNSSPPIKHASLSQLHFLRNFHRLHYLVSLFILFILTSYEDFSFLRARIFDSPVPRRVPGSEVLSSTHSLMVPTTLGGGCLGLLSRRRARRLREGSDLLEATRPGHSGSGT